MGDGPRGIKVFSDYFQVSESVGDSPDSPNSSVWDNNSDRFQGSTSVAESAESQSSSACDRSANSHSRSHRSLRARRKLRAAASMLKLFSRLPWGSDDHEKVVLTAAEVSSLRSEINDLEERAAHFKAQLEHVDEILRSAHLSGYLWMRTRWAALPGEPPTLDDNEVDDWLPRFLVLHGSCIYLYLSSTDLSPQDSTLLSDVTEVGPLPCITKDDQELRHCFFILTRQGLRYECSSASKTQVDSWLAALGIDCKLRSDSAACDIYK